MRFEGVQVGFLDIPKLDLPSCGATCVLGDNASGKSLLASLVAGAQQPLRGRILDRPARVALHSFESLQAAYERELENDDTDYLDRIDYGTTVGELLAQSGASQAEQRRTADRFELAALLERGYRQLSTGELRRVHLARELLAKPELLVLDEPYEGLDLHHRTQLESTLRGLVGQGQALLILVNAIEEIPGFCDTLIVLQRGRLLACGPRRELLDATLAPQLEALRRPHTLPRLPPPPADSAALPTPLVSLRDGSVRYGDCVQFSGFNWTLQPGQHTLVTGPNGSGKSTLLALITGDHPQCYVNRLSLFGYARGSGESIWDIKRHIGLVSPALHRDYRVSATTLAAVQSGFFDSIGLYQTPTAAQRALARGWLAAFGLAHAAALPFHSLSYGQQRLALIARALVKHPPLLILDEPTQGLDDFNRQLVLACLERLAALERCTLLFVSHREDERLPLFRQRLEFRPDPTGQARFRIDVQS